MRAIFLPPAAPDASPACPRKNNWGLERAQVVPFSNAIVFEILDCYWDNWPFSGGREWKAGVCDEFKIGVKSRLSGGYELRFYRY